VCTGPAPIVVNALLTGGVAILISCGTGPLDSRVMAAVSEVEAGMVQQGISGASLALLRNGRLVHATALGVKRAGDDAPVTDQTLFHVGSIQKMLTAATLLSLVDEGKLDLDAPVTQYVDLHLAESFDPSTITPFHLLTHSSALPEAGVHQCAETLAQYWDQQRLPLWAPPGSFWNYSSMGYSLAGLLAQTIDDAPFEEVIRRRVLEPARMSHATTDEERAQAADHATGHVPSGPMTGFYEPAAYHCDFMVPAGFMFATATDFAHFVEALLAEGGLLSRDSSRAMISPQIEVHESPGISYSFGLELGAAPDGRSPRYARHGGGMFGFSSRLAFLPETGDGAVLLTNADGADLAPILGRALFALRGDQFPDTPPPPPTCESAPGNWSEFEGIYRSVEGVDIKIEARDNGLWCDVDFRGQRYHAPLRHLVCDTFGFVEVGGELVLDAVFERDPVTTRPRWLVSRHLVGERSSP
jgi:CubicO group peptidase (beta-lactamase class C family)